MPTINNNLTARPLYKTSQDEQGEGGDSACLTTASSLIKNHLQQAHPVPQALATITLPMQEGGTENIPLLPFNAQDGAFSEVVVQGAKLRQLAEHNNQRRAAQGEPGLFHFLPNCRPGRPQILLGGMLLGAAALGGTLRYLFTAEAAASGPQPDSEGGNATLAIHTPDPDITQARADKLGTNSIPLLKRQLFKRKKKRPYYASQAEQLHPSLYDLRPLTLADLSDYQRLTSSGAIPQIFREFIAKYTSRDFYNRYLFDIFKAAMDTLKERDLSPNVNYLFMQTRLELAELLDKMKSYAFIHGLMIDPLYDQLLSLGRKISEITGESWASRDNTESLSEQNKKMRQSLRTLISYGSLRELERQVYDYYKELSRYEEARKPDSIYYPALEKMMFPLFLQTQFLSKRNPFEKIILRNVAFTLFNLNNQLKADIKNDDDSNYNSHFFMAGEVMDALQSPLADIQKTLISLLIMHEILLPKLFVFYRYVNYNLDTSQLQVFQELIDKLQPLASQRVIPAGREAEQAPLFPSADLSPGKPEPEIIPSIAPLPDGVNSSRPLAQPGSVALVPAGASNSTHSQLSEVSYPVLISGTQGVAVFAVVSYIAWFEVKARLSEFVERIVSSSSLDETNIEEELNPDDTDIERALYGSSQEKHKPERAKELTARTTTAAPDLRHYPAIPEPFFDSNYVFVNQRLAELAQKDFHGKEYSLVQGLDPDRNGLAPPYIKETQTMAMEHVLAAERIVNRLANNLWTRTSDETYQQYLRNYFAVALGTQDAHTLNEATKFFTTVVRRANNFFRDSSRKNYKNFFVMSTKQKPSTRAGQYLSLLTEEERQVAPYAVSYYYDNQAVAIISDTSYIVDPNHVAKCRREKTYDMTEIIIHEATHASSGTKDYFYLPKTKTGRLLNAKDALQAIPDSLVDMGIQEDLSGGLKNFFDEKQLIMKPRKVKKLLELDPFIRSFFIMNNAEHMTIFIRDISKEALPDAMVPK